MFKLLFGVPKFLVGPRWLFGTMFLGLLGGFGMVRVWDFLWDGSTNAVVNATRPATFVSTMTGISTKLGMDRFTSKVRGVRRAIPSDRDKQE